MGKTKKKGLSDKVHSKKKDAERKVNPFEVKINRQKHDVLGRKVGKHDKGMPGVSRSKAIKKRQETLLQEFKKRGKANKFIDKRFGETDAEMSVEDKMLQRFALERQRTHERAGQFHLTEEEDLTHYGQSLAEIEQFDTLHDSDEDDDDGKIDAKMVAEEHFGGFFHQRPRDDDKKPVQSWKQRMEEIIMKSKKEKYERQHQREQNLELTEKLDKEWKDLQSVIVKGGKRQEEEHPAKKEKDDYDMLVRELVFEAKGQATDRLKTEEELAKEEKERLDNLEAGRLRRMKGIVDEEEAEKAAKHRSADDLDDEYWLEQKPKAGSVSYKEGKLVKEKEEGSGTESDDEDGSGSEGEEEEDEEGDVESEEVEGEQEEGDKQEGDGDESDGGEDSESDDADDAMGRTSDLESDEEEEEEKEEEKVKEKGKKADKKSEDFRKVLKERKEMMEEARKEIPYTFKAPENYDDLLALVEGRSDEEQLIIVERVRKCHHPSLGEGNKEKLELLFGLLLEYYGDLAVQDPPHFTLLNRLVPHLYELTHMSPMSCGETILALIKDKQEKFTEMYEARGGKGAFPGLDVLLYLRLVALLFPTSDFHHPVVTPTGLFMSQLLTQCSINTRRDIASGLFLCNLFLEYVTFAKRYVPEAINFLCGVLFLAIPKDIKIIEPVIPPFKPVGRNINFLELQTGKDAKKLETGPVKLSEVFCPSKAKHLGTDAFRVNATWQCLYLLQRYAQLYEKSPAYVEIFAPVQHFCSKLITKHYPQTVQTLHTSLMDRLKQASTTSRTCLVLPRKKPQSIKMFEPKIEEGAFDGTKKRIGGNREHNEKQRLIHKHKKEMKGAAREIRKDTAFLAKQKLQDTMQKDSERKRKVKAIIGQLASQEGEFKALKRKKDS